jgi:hypothetical protein
MNEDGLCSLRERQEDIHCDLVLLTERVKAAEDAAYDLARAVLDIVYVLKDFPLSNEIEKSLEQALACVDKGLRLRE